MQPIFTTEGLHPRNRFSRWRDTVIARGLPMTLTDCAEKPFEARIEAAEIGPLAITRYAQNAVRGETTHEMSRRFGNDGILLVALPLAGTISSVQNDRSTVCHPGSLLVLDGRPAVSESSMGCRVLCLEVPRERLERVLGPASLFTSLEIGADLPSSVLASTFLRDLVEVHPQLESDGVDRMASIAVDLIVASIAERIARDVPQPMNATLLLQRAKAFIAANLHDHALDPRHLAVAMGVSLRRLQEVFHEAGQHIAEYIWRLRLDLAAKRLADPACAHLAVGLLAYGCGFVSQAHFSRRFKDHFGVTPREYRFAAA
ncbi:AraC-type DNA-binding protein [Methylobacterium phyllostachyos]|uniref:AraC-type DNA-binding protein n=1 Tax=Methylobacterium phyllostachyos TaxID=582672 RepID=A0A1G9ZJ97_9HYPH|nr:helix-turn-helix domain-containing protein [Methylobacterium phyllostachyos]SDN20583.1 AraC-type DNA-binding protein [Methylobacterium phyllostachyos]